MANKVLLLLLLTSFIACKKSNADPDPVSDSIYGVYSKSADTGDWWNDLLSTISLQVSPGAGGYIKIITDYHALYPIYTHVFDSVVLAGDNSFAVDQVIGDSFSSTGYSQGIGTGKFGTKTISLDFNINTPDSSINDRIIINNAKKISDL